MSHTSWRDLITEEMSRHGEDFSRVSAFYEVRGDTNVALDVKYHTDGLLDARWHVQSGPTRKADWVVVTCSRVYVPVLEPPHTVRSRPRVGVPMYAEA